MKKSKVISLLTVSALAVLALAAAAMTGGSDCPGTITCPLTGKVVCIDRCPANATPSCCAPDAAER